FLPTAMSHTSIHTQIRPPAAPSRRLNPDPAAIFARGERLPAGRATKAVPRAKRVKD
ncbi:hypothetical protein PoB_000045100, partial [Plakobranchus ocellatus]